MARVTVEWKRDIRRTFTHEMRGTVADALEAVGDNCLEEANRIIPHQDGILQDSGFVEVDRLGLEAQVAYSTPYAVVQHEDPTLKHDEGREDHWLEKTVDANRKRWGNFVAARVKRKHG